MSGALVALTAVGAHNRYTTAAPQMTLFKNAYRRHTAFAMMDRDNTFNGNADFGQTVVANIDRDADLIGPLTVEFGLPAATSTEGSTANWVDHVGHALIEEVTFSVGGHQFDKQTSDWLEIWSQLSTPESKWAGYEYLIGHREALRGKAALNSMDAASVYVPLPFYFCLSPKNYFPAISTQYHELKLRLKIRAASSLVRKDAAPADTFSTTGLSLSKAVVRTRYVYLTDDERRRFAYSAHEYLITQIQEAGSQTVGASSTESVSILSNHLVAGYYFVIRSSAATAANQWFNYTSNATKPAADAAPDLDAIRGENNIVTMKIALNGSELMNDAKEGDYFSVYQPYFGHTRVPYATSKGINVILAALDGESITSTGTWNASRIDRIQATIVTGDGAAGTLLVFARGFNISRHINGLAGIAYSN